MKNKNKKIYGKILATALVSVVVFLLNAGVVGAQTAIVDYECMDKQNCKVEAELQEKCEEDGKKLATAEQKKCDDEYAKNIEPCKDGYFKTLCETEANKIKIKCLDVAVKLLNTNNEECFKLAKTEVEKCDISAFEACSTLEFSIEIGKATKGYTGADLKCRETFLKNEVENCQLGKLFGESKTKIIDADSAFACFQDLEIKANTECKTVCGNKLLEGNEECDDGNTKKGDGCDDKCRREGVFRVAEVLKIEEGQTYLEKNETNPQSTSLRKGVYFFIIEAIELATKIIGALALLMVIIGGLIMMISSGNSQLQQKGKRIILYSILGLVIAFLSLVIVTFVQSLFYTT